MKVKVLRYHFCSSFLSWFLHSLSLVINIKGVSIDNSKRSFDSFRSWHQREPSQRGPDQRFGATSRMLCSPTMTSTCSASSASRTTTARRRSSKWAVIWEPKAWGTTWGAPIQEERDEKKAKQKPSLKPETTPKIDATFNKMSKINLHGAWQAEYDRWQGPFGITGWQVNNALFLFYSFSYYWDFFFWKVKNLGVVKCNKDLLQEMEKSWRGANVELIIKMLCYFDILGKRH